MQALDLPCNPSLDRTGPDPSTGSDHFGPIHQKTRAQNNTNSESIKNGGAAVDNNGGGGSSLVVRRERPSRACTQRAAARLQAAAAAEAATAEVGRKRKKAKRRDSLSVRPLKEDSDEEEMFPVEEEEEEEEGGGGDEENGASSSFPRLQFSRMVTPLVGEPEDSQLPRWNIRSMWQLASILDFLNVFRPLLNVKVEFSAEEFETALITPNNTLADIHIPLLKAIPPVTRMALGRATWITVVCRKLRDWWHWFRRALLQVAEGDLPIVASHGTEIEAYNALDPGVRVVILKALCDIRVEQEDIRNYIDDSIKRGVQLSAFRKERIGGDSYGISYWYEDDPIIGHRLYREIRRVEVKKGKGRNIPPIPHSSYQWEAVATNFDEFQNVSEKLFSSKNRTEVSVGKKLKNIMLPEIEKVHKRKEKLLKKQHRQALMLDNMMNIDGLPAGRSRRDRKPVTYTFDDYDRSINEAIKITKKKQPSAEPFDGKDSFPRLEDSRNNGKSGGPSQYSQNLSFSPLSPESFEDDEEFYDDQKADEALDRSNRRRQRPQRYSVREFVEAVSDNEADFDSDDDIVGEVVYDEEYLKKRKERKKLSSSSEGEEEYNWDEENPEEEEEEYDDVILSTSEDNNSDQEPRKFKAYPRRNTRETKKSRKIDELQSGLRRSQRSTKNRINYSQLEMSESDDVGPTVKSEKSNAAAAALEFSRGGGSEDSYEKANDELIEELDEKEIDPTEEVDCGDREGVEGVKKRRLLDLNEVVPGSGFDDGPNSTRDEDENDL
ncbi:hypothetical protein ABFX02_04G161900 [Erythranthe guttata]